MSTEIKEPGQEVQPPEHDEAAKQRAKLASGFVVIKSAAISIGAAGVMAVMGVIAVPLLVHQLGAAKFGIISLAWIVIGYASVLDLGLGRALTKLTADRLGAGRADEIPEVFWTALAMLTAIGCVTGGIVVLISNWITYHALSIGPNLTSQAQWTFILLGCTVPFVLTSTALQGNLEAHQRFDLTNGVSLPLSFLSYFGPVAIAFFTHNLAICVTAVCLSRVLATFIYGAICLRVDPLLAKERAIHRSGISPLLRYGGWVTVASIATGVMLTLDRLLIGTRVSAAAVAFYATPYEVAKQLLFVSGTFAGVLFPGFAANVGRDQGRTEKLFSRGVRASFVGLFPLVLFASVMAHQILTIWVSSEFGDHGGPILQLLPVGILINGVAYVAYSLILSTRPDLVAKLSLVELPLYLGGLYLLLGLDGIRGAAIGFCLRTLFDTSALYFFCWRLRLVPGALLFSMARLVAGGLVFVLLGNLIPGTGAKLGFVLIVIALFIPYAWLRILMRDERDAFREKLSGLSQGRLGMKGSDPDPV